MGLDWRKDQSADSQSSILEQLIHKLFAAAADSMFVVDDTGAFLAANSASCKLSGYSEELLLQLNLSDLFAVGKARQRPLHYDDLPLEETVRYGCFLHERDGRSLPVDIETSPLGNGRLLLTIHHGTGSSRFSTGRGQAETEIKKLAKFPDENPYPVMRVAQDGVLLYANQASAGLLKEWGCAIGQHLPATWHRFVLDTLASGLTREEEAAVGLRVFSLFFVPLREDGYVNIYGYDITDRKQVRRELNENQDRLVGIIASAMDAVISLDDDQRIVLFNIAAEEMFGYPAATVIGRSHEILLPERLRGIHQQRIQQFGKSSITSRKIDHLGMLWALRADGQEFPIEASVSQVRVGRTKLYTAIVRDVTESVQAERAIMLMSNTQQQIAHLNDLQEIYQLVGSKVQELIGDGYTVTSMLDEKIQAMRVVGLFGFGSQYENLVRRFKIDPSRMVYSLADMTAEELRIFRSGQLEMFGSGLYGLLTRKVPRRICEAVEKWLKINAIYTMGFVWGGIHYGGLIILARKDIGPYKEMIETLMNQAAIAIKRIKSETALRESEEKLRLFIEHAPASLAMFDMEMRYLAVSRRWLAGYDLGDQDVIGRSYYDVLPEVPEHWETAHRQGLAGNVVANDEDKFLRLDGSTQWQFWEVRPWTTADGTIGGIVIFTEDITERKLAREALRESQDILTTAESVAKIGSWKWDFNTQKVTWSAEMYNLFGVDRADFDGDVNRVINTRIHPDDIEAVNQSNLSVLEHFDPSPLEYRIVLPNGTERTVWAEGRLISDQSGHPTALVGYVQDITERKLAEQALQESQERYHSTLENMLEGCQIIGFDWRYLYLNASAARHGRRRKEELLGKTMMAAYPGIEDTELFTVLRRCMADRTAHRMENKFYYDDDSFAWFDLSIQPVPEGIFILSIDITERKQVETALLEMAENMAAAQQITHYGSWEVRLTPELEFIDPQMWSDECFRIFGIEPGSAQITKDYFYDHVHPEDREAAQQALWQAIHDGAEASYEYRLFRPDGSIRNIHDRVKIVVDKQNERPVKVVGIVQDITESKRAEATIDQLHQRMELILNSAGEGIYGTDVDGRITFVNPAMARMTGWESDELLGENAHDVFHHTRADGRPYPATECNIRLATLNGRSAHIDDDTYWRKNGTPLSVEYTSTPIWQDGQIIGSVMVVKDITERKHAADEQAWLEEQLRQAQKMESIGRLAGGVAHDFNNQLTVIQLYGDLLRAGMAQNDPLLPKLEQIRKASNHAADLTQQLLAFSRKQILQPVVLNLNELVANLQKMLARLIGEDIIFSTVLEPGLWPIMADPGQIEQVIMNLVVNARDAMPTGGTLTIETGNLIIDEQITSIHLDIPPGPCVMLAVSDTGYGMDKVTLNQIFEPFFTTKEVGKGTGLGLATVHGIVKQSGGAIYVYSEPGQGAAFKIYLPASQSETIRLTGDKSTRLERRGHETILLVEDEAALGDLVRKTLEEMGYTVLAASSGREALDLAEQHPTPIDLLLADVVMPQMSGWELFQALSARQPDVKVLFMSGYMDDDMVRHGVLTAEVDFLSKPFTRSTLAAKVRDVLDKA